MLDNEIVSYKESFVEELERLSCEIRVKIKEDLEVNKHFYKPDEPTQEEATTTSMSQN